jgi:hypothetical protein
MCVGRVQGADPDTFSPIVSFVYLESLDEPEVDGAIMSPVVSFQALRYTGWVKAEGILRLRSPAIQ